MPEPLRLDRTPVGAPRGPLFVTRFQRHADSTTLLFLHPVNLSADCWMSVAERMSDFSCVLIDHRGHGRSHMNGPFRVDDYAADALAVIEAFKLRAIHLVGASIGGSVACAVAAAIPKTARSLTALGASLEPADPDTLEALEQWRAAGASADLFDEFLEQERQRGLSPSLAAEARREIGLETRCRDVIEEVTWNAFSEDARRFAKDVRCPALVLTGEHDTSCPPAAGARMAAALSAPFEILPGLGHLPMLQAPALVAERLTRFIQGVAKP